MFVSSSSYADTLRNLLAQPGPLSLAVAFWGASAVDVIPAGREIRLLCNLYSGGTNPVAIDELRQRPGITIRHDPRLHAKVAFSSQSAQIGSANVSANGLNLEDGELSGWEEAGWLTSDTAQITSIGAWFDKIWDKAPDVAPADIKLAKGAWRRRRRDRPLGSANICANLFSLTDAHLRDRNVLFVLYREEPDAQERAQVYRARSGRGEPPINSRTPLFTDWPLISLESIVVSVRYRSDGGLEWDGVFMLIEISDSTAKRRVIHNWVCRELDDVFGTRVDHKATLSALKPHVAAIWAKAKPRDDNDGRMIPLIKAIEVWRKAEARARAR